MENLILISDLHELKQFDFNFHGWVMVIKWFKNDILKFFLHFKILSIDSQFLVFPLQWLRREGKILYIKIFSIKKCFMNCSFWTVKSSSINKLGILFVSNSDMKLNI